MSDTIKRVRIEADASSLQGEMERISSSGNQLYNNLKQEAQQYSESLDKQSIYIEKNIALEKRRLEQQIQYSRNELDIRKNRELENALPNKVKDIEEKYKKQRKFIDSDYLIAKQEMLDANRKHYLEFGDEQKTRPTVEESNIDINRAVSRTSTSMVSAGRMGMRFASILTTAMGLGIAFGIGGMLHSMVENAVRLDKSTKDLRSTMDGLDTSMLNSASSIGKTKMEMLEFTKEVAVTSGGAFGSSTGNVALRTAQFSKAYGVDENQILQTLSTQRMTNSNVSGEIVTLLKEMLTVGAISKNNLAQLGEKIDFWSRLNNMQSQQVLTVSPIRSTGIISAFQGTGLPVLSDQRQMDLIEKMNNAIKNPGNEYMSAFVMNALDKGNLVDTLIRKEQGIFGKDNLKDILDSLKQNFGSTNREPAYFALEKFTGSLQVSKEMVDKLFDNPEKYKKFSDSLSLLSKHAEDYEKAITQKQKDEILKQWLKDEEDFNKNKFGLNSTQARSKEMTGIAESLKSQITNIAAETGLPVIKSIAEIIGKSETKEALQNAASALSYAAAEIIKAAAPLILEAAKLFTKAVHFFLEEESSPKEKAQNLAEDIISKNKELSDKEKEYVTKKSSKIMEEMFVNPPKNKDVDFYGNRERLEEEGLKEVKNFVNEYIEKKKQNNIKLKEGLKILKERYPDLFNDESVKKYFEDMNIDSIEKINSIKNYLKDNKKENFSNKKDSITKREENFINDKSNLIEKEDNLRKIISKDDFDKNRNIRKQISSSPNVSNIELNQKDNKDILVALTNAIVMNNNIMSVHSERVKKANEQKELRLPWNERINMVSNYA